MSLGEDALYFKDTEEEKTWTGLSLHGDCGEYGSIKEIEGRRNGLEKGG